MMMSWLGGSEKGKGREGKRNIKTMYSDSWYPSSSRKCEAWGFDVDIDGVCGREVGWGWSEETKVVIAGHVKEDKWSELILYTEERKKRNRKKEGNVNRS